jgi:hypothetical protein
LFSKTPPKKKLVMNQCLITLKVFMADIRKLEKELGWKPIVGVERGS